MLFAADGTYEGSRLYAPDRDARSSIALYSRGESGTWNLEGRTLALRPQDGPPVAYEIVGRGRTWLELRRVATDGSVGDVTRMCGARARRVRAGPHIASRPVC